MSKLVFNPLTGQFDTVLSDASELGYSPATPADWGTVPDDVAEALDTVKAEIVDNQELVKEPTGFPNRTDTTLSFVDLTREFTIAPTGATFDVYIKGHKYTKTSESITISNDDGNHYIYFDESGVLSETSVFSPSIFENNALISIIYWNSVEGEHSYFAEERHGLVMDGATHGYLHTVFGARYLSGLALESFVVDGDGTLNTQAQFQADQGTIRDEDIIVTLPLTSNIPVLFREGTIWRKKAADAYPVIYNGTVGYVGTNIAYNELVGASWQLTEVINNNYVLMHVFATNDIENPFVAILGINSYANIPEARAGAESEISSLSGLPFAEFVAIGTVIYQTNSAYTNVPKAIVRSASAGEDYVDFRGEQLYTPSGIATSHSLLSNLSSDDHLQYYNEARGDARYVRNATNLGATGESVFAQKTTTDLEFKKLKAGTNVSLSSDADSITISSTDTGEVNTASNVGAGEGVFKQKTGVDLEFKSLVAGTGISLSSDANEITIENTLTPVTAEIPYIIQTFSGDALTTDFTLTTPCTVKESLLVFIDGVYQEQTAYSYASPIVSFTSAPPTGTNNIEVRFQTTDAVILDLPKLEIYNTTIAIPFGVATMTGILHFKVPYNSNIVITQVQLFEKNGVVSGTLEVDVKKNSTPNNTGMTSIFSAKPSFDFATASDYDVSTGVVGTSTITAGDYLRLDITSVPSGFVGNIQVAVYAA